MPAYYNENDAYVAQWLRNLIAGGHIAPGDVDERSIRDVQPSDLNGYEQCHFFAGIGGWSYALRLAGIPDARPLWTGSCPCQPFSAAGRGTAANDDRHLWPEWFRLIRACRPSMVLGEQVESAIGWGWLDLVYADLGAQGYATRFAVLPACGVGAPHIRQRLWFVADAGCGSAQHQRCDISGTAREDQGAGNQRQRLWSDVGDGFAACGVADDNNGGREVERAPRLHDSGQSGHDATGRSAAGELADDAEPGRDAWRGASEASGGRDAAWIEPGRLCDAGELADTASERQSECQRIGIEADRGGRAYGDLGGQLSLGIDGGAGELGDTGTAGLSARECAELSGAVRPAQGRAIEQSGSSPWADCVWLICTDGKARPTQSGIFPLASGVSARVGRLRAYGNAIVPALAAEFIKAVMS